MTENKPIIIDGIDVSGCIYYEDGKCLNGEMVQCNCKNVAVCYYKEYKRKEQECERLKNERTVDLVKQLDQLKAENKQLKRQVENDKVLITNAGKQNYQLVQEYDRLKAENEELKKELDKVYEDIKLSPLCYKCSEEDCLKKEIDKLKTENESYKKMLDNPEIRVVLADFRSGERDLWQKYKPRMEQAEQKLEKIKEFVTALCYTVMSDGLVTLQKDILQIIDEVE